MKNHILLIIVILFASCDRIKYPEGSFPVTPVNLDFINSSSDDINSNAHFFEDRIEFVFSTNRPGPFGNDFNLLTFNIAFSWDQKEGIFAVRELSPNFQTAKYTSIKRLAESTASPSDEKGPYSYQEAKDNMILLFSRNYEGVHSITSLPQKPVTSLNSNSLPYFRMKEDSSNEMYPCFYGKEFIKGNLNGDGIPEKILFSSDKDGQFDIYEMDIPTGMTPLEFLADSAPKEIRKLSINTSSNDHMPFVLGDKLVFASDRPGGLGGYDLYYAKKTAEGWSSPVNFGHPINSEFDEYRPIISPSEMFQNNPMIFSSNRPGGKGGFDLYYVGVPK
ncbi:TolB family protein [Cecembia calidifontis]|jgi:hypothetical protein|uniref:WD40 repeat protein n=1 Tax=Cecembia calidifontis TaxID=1187080 RepID=A0A4Q7PFM9_9BACT|nr:PD40 domain-containing protein [Cecembia calidifontis]RZS98628.1 WD40 repeat protein [Cecembia calidifontis]